MKWRGAAGEEVAGGDDEGGGVVEERGGRVQLVELRGELAPPPRAAHLDHAAAGVALRGGRDPEVDGRGPHGLPRPEGELDTPLGRVEQRDHELRAGLAQLRAGDGVDG